MEISFTADRVLFEDNHYIAVNKTCHDIVQADKSGDLSLLDQVKEFIKVRDKKSGNVFLEVTHRIDRPVSGAVLFAKTSKGLTRMNELFREGKVKKVYWAFVKQLPPKESDMLTHHLVRNSQQNKSFVYDKPKPSSKESILKYTIIGKTKTFYLLEIDLITGRHHQIRCQLAKIGCSIKGDLKYGFPRSNPDGGIDLHSKKISFTHPISGDFIEIVAPTPNDKLWNEFDPLS